MINHGFFATTDETAMSDARSLTPNKSAPAQRGPPHPFDRKRLGSNYNWLTQESDSSFHFSTVLCSWFLVADGGKNSRAALGGPSTLPYSGKYKMVRRSVVPSLLFLVTEL